MIDELILTSEQQEAIDICCDTTNKIACVTGEAGTGKTSILRDAYYKLYNDLLERYEISEEEYKKKR